MGWVAGEECTAIVEYDLKPLYWDCPKAKTEAKQMAGTLSVFYAADAKVANRFGSLLPVVE